LTRQLLAFGRGTAGQSQPVSPNLVVVQLERMLRRVLGEDIRIDVVVGEHVGRVQADPLELEQLLLNLALNARDAMPHGGRLTIETRSVEAPSSIDARLASGRYALLTVSDEGIGMDAVTRGRIFEPFFTTKPEGAGSGLGLATVQRIVERAGGVIRVASEAGVGTTFSVYLPQIEEADARPDPPAHREALPGGRETVLIAEDSEACAGRDPRAARGSRLQGDGRLAGRRGLGAREDASGAHRSAADGRGDAGVAR